MQVRFTAHIRQIDNRKLFENGNGQRIGRAALGKQVLRSQGRKAVGEKGRMTRKAAALCGKYGRGKKVWLF